MALADDFRAAIRSLPDDWADARFAIRFGDDESAARAGGFLGPLGAGRLEETVRFSTSRRGAEHGPDLVAAALRRIDGDGLHGELELVGTSTSATDDTAAATPRATLVGGWKAELAALPPDWSDMYAEIRLRSTDDLERTALLTSPVNPTRSDAASLRFRCARAFGYGAAPAVVQRCLERLDDAGVRGEVRVLRVLSDTRPAATQGPVWYVEGKAV